MGRRRTARRPGKWRRVGCVEGEQTTPDVTEAPTTQAEIQEEGREERGQEPEADAEPARSERECDLIDLYAVASDQEAARPFVHEVKLMGPKGEVVRVRATFDDGAMICAMSMTVFEKVRHRLGAWTPSKRALRMANGTLTKSEASWTGTVELEGVKTTGTFEVFDSAGGWSFLLGKPMLQSFRACHNYEKGEIQVRDENRSTILTNQIDSAYYAKRASRGLPATADWKQNAAAQKDTAAVATISEQREDNGRSSSHEDRHQTQVEPETPARQVNPFHPKRVEAILKAIKIGDGLDDAEQEQVRQLVGAYADCFALSVREVTLAKDAKLHLGIPPDAQLPTKARQRTFTPPQRRYLHKKVLEMQDAGIIERADPAKIKCVSATTLGQKQHEGMGLTLEELQHKVNKECEAAGLTPHFQVPPEHIRASTEASTTQKEQKWRICQDFREVNKFSKVAPMPQGDIRAKQHRLSGHKYVSVVDFASGFYAVEINQESRPYTAFYIEGLGHFWYARMPFGLTGAPTAFAAMAAGHLHDLIAEETLEIFVDDGGTAADTFDEMKRKLTRILNRVRDRKLSLSAAKSQLFMSEAMFAGARVGAEGVLPDLTKLTAIVDWRRPNNALNLVSFLGLTGHFRDLIRGYARVEGPLRDLLGEVKLPQPCTKSSYRRVMAAHELESRWKEEHTNAFLNLKIAITSEPILRGPRWDGTPFVVTTDGSKDGFAGVLAQRFPHTRPDGTIKHKLHPIAFASKRTSASEAKYKPFLLEFAALKFALDKFTDTIWGFPVEIETDCQALRDTLLSEKPSAVHARWRDGILAHQIVDVRHVPGKINVVADGLSRQWEGQQPTGEDGSEWTVNPDRDDQVGLVNDILLTVEGGTQEQVEALRDRLQNEHLFVEVVDAIVGQDKAGTVRDRMRARHRASQYVLEEGKLWKLHGGTSTRARTRTECVSRKEAEALANEQHQQGGHMGRDAIKIALTDKITSPDLDLTITKAIRSCTQCKSFGPTRLNALLQPITRRHPFEMLVGDYLSMPTGKGGYHTIGLYLDTFSQHIWAFKYKTAGSARTTVDALSTISRHFVAPETFMTDGGSHFNNATVKEFCDTNGCKHHVTPAYSPWVNGLVEGTNRILLHVLKRMCAPKVGEQDDDGTWADLPKAWPDNLDAAVSALNKRILPALKFTPKELLLGIAINTPRTTLEAAGRSTPTAAEAAVHMAYAAQQRIDGYEAVVKHATSRKSTYDGRIAKKSGEVEFRIGQLIQIYRSDLDYTFKTERKMIPKWSQPYRIRARIRNAYKLERTDGGEIEGEFSTRRLREFIPKPGGRSDTNQKDWLKDNPESEEAKAVRTPLFARGEHGMGIKRQAGQEAQSEGEAREHVARPLM
jgi:transposase InsO family protein